MDSRFQLSWLVSVGLCLLGLNAEVRGENDLEDWRVWRSQVGTKIEAVLVDSADRKAQLKKRDGTFITVPWSQLSSADQALLEERQLEAAITITSAQRPLLWKGIEPVAGKTVGPVVSLEDEKASYFIYFPDSFVEDRIHPVCFVMSPRGGKNPSQMSRYHDAANRFGVILVLSVESKNKFEGSNAAMLAMAEDAFKRLPIEDKLAFATGMSGGSRMAYLLAEMDDRVDGVLACGSGGGVYLDLQTFREAILRDSTYVYSLIGTNCFNRTGTFFTHSQLKPECRMRFFPGNHDWASPQLIEQGTARVLGALLETLDEPRLELLRKNYCAAVID